MKSHPTRIRRGAITASSSRHVSLGLRAAGGELRDALAAAALDETTAAEEHAQATEIDAALQEPYPGRRRVAHTLARLTRVLVHVGSLTTASAALIGPLHTLAGWLGTLGTPILSMLPG